MKRIILFAMIVAVSFGCSKDDISAPTAPTTYQVYNNMPYQTPVLPYLDGSLYEVIVYCYVGSDIVRQDNYEKIAPGEKTAAKVVLPSYTKIKVSTRMLPPLSAYYSLSQNARRYTVTYTLLVSEKNTLSEINGNSMMSLNP